MADQQIYSRLAALLANTQADNPDPQNDLTRMHWSDLANLRAATIDNPSINNQLAPYEHRAYAREQVANNPLMAIPYAAMVPGYQLAKLAGFQMGDGGQTPPSLSQFGQGMMGIYDGLSSRFK